MPAGLGARDTLRLEAGLPLHGHELGPGITPLQAGLGWVVAWGKPEFRGREALVAEREPASPATSSGSPPRAAARPRAECAVLVDGDVVGVVTSGNFSPVLGHGIALGFVPPAVEAGTAGQRRRPRHRPARHRRGDPVRHAADPGGGFLTLLAPAQREPDSEEPAAGQVPGWNSTLTASSSFFWKIS